MPVAYMQKNNQKKHNSIAITYLSNRNRIKILINLNIFWNS
jgi:hypothetical protein